jgi:hypothetical protein
MSMRPLNTAMVVGDRPSVFQILRGDGRPRHDTPVEFDVVARFPRTEAGTILRAAHQYDDGLF